MSIEAACPFCGGPDHQLAAMTFGGVPVVVCPKVPKELSGRIFLPASVLRDATGDRAEPGESTIFDAIRRRVLARTKDGAERFFKVQEEAHRDAARAVVDFASREDAE